MPQVASAATTAAASEEASSASHICATDVPNVVAATASGTSTAAAPPSGGGPAQVGTVIVLLGPLGFAPRVISDCHFRKKATEYDRKPGIKWFSCTEKLQSDTALFAPG